LYDEFLKQCQLDICVAFRVEELQQITFLRVGIRYGRLSGGRCGKRRDRQSYRNNWGAKYLTNINSVCRKMRTVKKKKPLIVRHTD